MFSLMISDIYFNTKIKYFTIDGAEYFISFYDCFRYKFIRGEIKI